MMRLDNIYYNKEIEHLSVYTNFLKIPENMNKVIEILSLENVKSLSLTSLGDEELDLKILDYAKNICTLVIDGKVSSLNNLEYKLLNLKTLCLEGGKISFDLEVTPNLERLVLEKFDSSRIFNMDKLLKLDAISFANSKIHQDILLPKQSLRKVCFSRCVIEDFNLLNGIQIVEMEIWQCNKITNFSSIRIIQEHLLSLEITNMKTLGKNMTDIIHLQSLKKLIISNCGSLESLSFIKKMSKLKFLSFVDTNIVDGDLNPCMTLEYAGTLDKRHYNMKNKDLPKKSIE